MSIHFSSIYFNLLLLVLMDKTGENELSKLVSLKKTEVDPTVL